jgi:hypothetical protein
MNGPRLWHHRDSFHHLQPLFLECLDLVRIVRQQLDCLPVNPLSEAEISKDGAGNIVFAFVGTMSKQDVGSYSIVTEILEVICADLGE